MTFWKSFLTHRIAPTLVLMVGMPLLAQRPVSLEEAEQIARDNSPQLRQVRMNLEQSAANLRAQNAALKSQFSLTLAPFTFQRSREFNQLFSTFNTSETRQSGGILRVDQPLKWTDGTLSFQNQFFWRQDSSEFQGARTEGYTNNLFVSYSQPLFTYNRTRLNLEAVELDLQASQITYDLRNMLLEQEVAQLFYAAFQGKMALQVAEEEYQNTQESYAIIKNKVDAGLVALEELYQAELNLANSRSTVQNNQVTFQNALDDLKELVGLPLEEDISVAAEISEKTVLVDLEKALAEGLSNRLELRQREIDILNAEQTLTQAGATNEFRGTLNMTYGLIGNDQSADRIYDNPTRNQSFELSLEIPIFDWGEKDARLQAARIGVQRQSLNKETESTGIAIGIRKAWRNLKNQEIQIEIARQNVRVAQLTYDINLEKYRSGDLTSLDLNLYQNQLSERKINQVNALISFRLALLDLKVKTLFDFENNRRVITTSTDNQ